MRICIVAEHASYRFGGEAVLPVHYFSRLRARGIEAWLVVHARTREELEAAFPMDVDRLRFIEDAWFHKFLFRISNFLPRRIAESSIGLLSLLITQYLARQAVSELTVQESIDLVHQPIPVSPRFPSLMAKLGVPIIIGPMNGGMEYPRAFRHAESILSRIIVLFGRRLAKIVNSLMPGKKLASVLLVANQRTRLALPCGLRGQVIELPENGVDLDIWSPSMDYFEPVSEMQKSPRFIFIGRLVDWKCLDVAIEALSHVPDAQLEVIGDGPMRDEWEQLTLKLGVSSRVVFSGWLSQKACAARLQSAVALVLPSILECGGAVVLETMAAGVAVIATKWGGPADYLDSTCGFLIEPSSRSALVEGFTRAMRRIIESPELGRRMGMNGRERVRQDFDWDKKINYVIDLYRRTISGWHLQQTQLFGRINHDEA
jgi:glycosyltransferase involved in cell wall biosynthesis